MAFSGYRWFMLMHVDINRSQLSSTTRKERERETWRNRKRQRDGMRERSFWCFLSPYFSLEIFISANSKEIYSNFCLFPNCLVKIFCRTKPKLVKRFAAHKRVLIKASIDKRGPHVLNNFTWHFCFQSMDETRPWIEEKEREREREKTVKRDDFSQQVEMLMGWSRGALWSLSVLRNWWNN